MSQSHLRKSKKPPQAIGWWRIGLSLAIFVGLSVALFVVANWVRSVRSTYETTTGKILEIRKVVDGTHESQYGGKIDYGVEAHVEYIVDGQSRNR